MGKGQGLGNMVYEPMLFIEKKALLSERGEAAIEELGAGAIVDNVLDADSPHHRASGQGPVLDAEILAVGDGATVLDRDVETDTAERDVAEVDRAFPAVWQDDERLAAGRLAR